MAKQMTATTAAAGFMGGSVLVVMLRTRPGGPAWLSPGMPRGSSPALQVPDVRPVDGDVLSVLVKEVAVPVPVRGGAGDAGPEPPPRRLSGGQAAACPRQ